MSPTQVRTSAGFPATHSVTWDDVDDVSDDDDDDDDDVSDDDDDDDDDVSDDDDDDNDDEVMMRRLSPIQVMT